MAAPEFWLIAGPNGAGKTTAISHSSIRVEVQHVRFLNADDRTLAKLREEGWSSFSDAPFTRLEEVFVAAAEEVFEELTQSLAVGEPIGTETVLSTLKYQPIVERVLAAAGFFGLLYIGLRSPELSAQRIAHRVSGGGHDVPAEKLAARWRRSIRNLGWFARRADRVFVFDNSDATLEEPPLLIAEGGGGALEIFAPDAIPAITESLLTAFSDAPPV